MKRLQISVDTSANEPKNRATSKEIKSSNLFGPCFPRKQLKNLLKNVIYYQRWQQVAIAHYGINKL